jgi:hypothetical protein
VNAHRAFDLVRPALPDWPRLMGAELAAAYVGISENTLREHGPQAKSIGRRRLWDRTDLDRWADALGGQPLEGSRRTTRHAHEVERQFLEARRKKGKSQQ